MKSGSKNRYWSNMPPPPKRNSTDDNEHILSGSAREKSDHFPQKSRPNAFTELMSRPPKKLKLPPNMTDPQTSRTLYSGRDGLVAYTRDPESFPSNRVVYFNDKFVVINDLFPKSSVHLLILPRNTEKNILKPQDAFDDPTFLAECREEEKNVRALVASELRRKYGKFSAAEKLRTAAMESDDPPSELPLGRDWNKEVISGIHANPSMNHLHIHVMSRDMMSECLKKTSHYLSFTTDFFVGLDQFPLAKNDYKRHYRHFPEDMICWRCGKNFKRKMASLKEHLETEYVEWKKE